MDQRGRKSAASLAVVSPGRPAGLLAPPAGLSAFQSDLWRAVVAGKPAGWFAADTAPLLSAYCRAAAEHRRVDAALALCEDGCLENEEGLRRYQALVAVQDKLARQLCTLAVKLRVSQSASMKAERAEAANRRAKGARPWDAGQTGT